MSDVELQNMLPEKTGDKVDWKANTPLNDDDSDTYDENDQEFQGLLGDDENKSSADEDPEELRELIELDRLENIKLYLNYTAIALFVMILGYGFISFVNSGGRSSDNSFDSISDYKYNANQLAIDYSNYGNTNNNNEDDFDSQLLSLSREIPPHDYQIDDEDDDDNTKKSEEAGSSSQQKKVEYYPEEIVLIGERNSGLAELAYVISRCYPDIRVTTSLSRDGYWFQTPDIMREDASKTLVIGVFLNVYDWIDLMHQNPLHAPKHTNMDWISFVQYPWTMDRPKVDEKFESDHGNYCQYHFEYKQVIPCHVSLFEQQYPVYELKTSSNNIETFQNILELRAEKIRNFFSTIYWESVTNFIPVKIEDMIQVEGGIYHLLNKIQEKSGLQAFCSDVAPMDESDFLGIPFKLRQDAMFDEYLDNHVDWSAENLVGYNLGEKLVTNFVSFETKPGSNVEDADHYEIQGVADYSKIPSINKPDADFDDEQKIFQQEVIAATPEIVTTPPKVIQQITAPPQIENVVQVEETPHVTSHIVEDTLPLDFSNFKRLTPPVQHTNGPNIAWLLTFPSSGTTYTTQLIKKASNTTTATNYGNEYLNKNNESIPVYSDIKGPYIWEEDGLIPNTNLITKTHCGSRCQSCPPKEYIETIESFKAKCLRAPRVISSENAVKVMVAAGVLETLVFDIYDADIVKKIVHVIKDPFDNIVSRFHHEYKSLVQKFESKDKFPYEYNAGGFQKYCRDEDAAFMEEEAQYYTPTQLELSRAVPCHADFYRYIQWHKLAIQMADHLHIPTLIINYEDYGIDLEYTVQTILDFLELPKVGSLIPYKWSSARDHFTDDQIHATALFLKELADEKTWFYVVRYFPSFGESLGS